MIYPNPTDGKFRIELGSTTEADIIITDLTGKEIMKRQSNQNIIYFDLRGFETGIYIINVFTSEGVQSGKIIVR